MKPPESSVPTVTLHTFQGGWGVRSLSPFCLKADAMLTLAGVPMTPLEPSGPPKTRSGKLPALDAGDGVLIEGSDAIADWMRDARGIDLDQGLSPAQKALALMLRRTLEEHLYFVMVKERWAEDRGFRMIKPAYFGHLPPVIRDLVPMMIRGGVAKSVKGQGIGRMSTERVSRRIAEDLDALCAVLGDNEWFFGDRPTSTDVVAYAFLGNVLAQPEDSELRSAVAGRQTLVDHVERMGALLYTDATS